MSLGSISSVDRKYNRKKRQIAPSEVGSGDVGISADLAVEAVLTREQVMKVLTAKEIPDLEKARAVHLKSLYAKGEILPENHAIFAKVKEVVDQLDMPPGTELLVTDNELFQAYFNPSARQIVVSRGVLQYFSKNLKDFSKDHLAALLAHETEHAVAYKDKKVHDVNTADKVMSTFDPAEELRADAEGMKRMAKGGFNPKAMIEILRSFGLNAEREGLMHPEIIDRVRYLDLRLVSDEHPLANTTKDFQGWDKEFLDWAVEPSGVYEKTEQLLAADLDGIDKILVEVKTLNEFLNVYKFKQAYRLIREVKAAKGSPMAEELFRSLLIYKSLEDVRCLYDTDSGLRYFGEASDALDAKKYIDLKNASAYIEKVEKVTFNEVEDALIIKKTKAEIDLAIDKTLAKAGRLTWGAGFDWAVDLVAKIERYRQSGEHEWQLFSQSLVGLDREQIKKDMLKDNENRSKHGARAAHEDMSKAAGVDFYDAKEFAETLELYKEYVLLKSLDKPSLQDADVATLGALFKANGFKDDQADFFGRLLLGGITDQQFTEYLKGIAKEDLDKFLHFFENNLEQEELRLSPVRSLHVAAKKAWGNFAYGQSFGLQMGYRHHFPNGGVDGMGSGLNAVIYSIAWEYYTRGYEQGYLDDIATPYKSPDQVDLIEEDWRELLKSGLPSMSEEVLKLSILKIVKSNGELSKVDDFHLDQLKETGTLPYNKQNLKISDFTKLLECKLWDAERTQELLKKILEDYYRKLTAKNQKISVQDTPDDFIELLNSVRQLAQQAPVGFVPQSKYDEAKTFSEEELSKMILHVEQVRSEEHFFEALEGQLQAGNKVGYSCWTEEMRLSLAKFDQDKWQALLVIPAINEKANADLKMLLKMFLDITNLPLANQKSGETLEKMVKSFSSQRPSLVYGEWLLLNFQEFPEMINRMKASVEDEILQQSYLMMMHDFLPLQRQEAFYQLIKPGLSLDVDRGKGRKNAYYDYQEIIRHGYDLNEDEKFVEEKIIKANVGLIEGKLGKSLADCSREDIEEILPDLYVQYLAEIKPEEQGEGLQAEVFADLLRRRFNFVEKAVGYQQAKELLNKGGIDWMERMADVKDQRFLAVKLRQAEAGIFGSNVLGLRVVELLKVAPHQTVVRDIYLEKFAYDVLKEKNSSEEIMKVVDLLWPLMTDACFSKETLGIRYLDACFDVQPKLLEKAQSSLDLIRKYLPKGSFARNSFLDRIELKANLKVAQLQDLKNLRFSEEGKENKDDNGIKTLLTGKINEMNRQERITFYFWLTSLKRKKPINILNLEMQTYGDAKSFKAYFVGLKAEEQQLLVKRLCLGAEGIFDLEAAGQDASAQAEVNRAEFVEQLLMEIIGKEGKQAKFIKGILRSLLLSAEPAKSAEILSVLTSKFLEARMKNKEINLPETVGMVLGGLGVVGKKLAQSLAELDFVPEDYQKEFKKMQSAAQVVPKHALAELADFYGLLEGKDGLKIVSFDRMLGAASNKQACLLEVEVADSKWGLPLGVHQLVGKFKRPSAQKSDNLDKDLHLVEKILSDLSAEKDLKKMPPGFIDTLKDSVLRELDFEEEAKFAKHLRGDFAKLEQHDLEYKLSLPKIIYASSDLVLETLATGISLREFMDEREAGNLAEGYKRLDLVKISKKVLTEALRELLVSGNVHADLHPGNVFVDENKQISLIDVGMNERLSIEQCNQVGKLLMGLLGGSAALVKSSLTQLGMQRAGELSLRVGRFEANVKNMVIFAKSSGEKLPGLISSLFSSISKLSTYAKFLKASDMADVFKDVGKLYGQKKLGWEGFDLEDLGM